jgi:predicted metalloprotease
MPRRRIGRGGKIGGLGIAAAVVVMLMGGDPSQILSMLSGGGSNMSMQQPRIQSRQQIPANDDEAQFVSVVLASTEDAWNQVFRQRFGKNYSKPKLVLYSNSTPTACGHGQAATGPFYCPADKTVYIDLSFFSQLRGMGAPGDFARAYVIGHEVGHHVQNLFGTSSKVSRIQRSSGKRAANAASVKLELQADCFAGVWASHANKDTHMLEPGDIEEGLKAAKAVGDDTLMRSAGRAVQPESFTHGSSKQRMQWFRTGYQSGNIARCNTFGT